MTQTRTEYLVRYPDTLDGATLDEQELCLTEEERDRFVRYLRSRGRHAGVELRIETYRRTITVGEWELFEEPLTA